MTPSASTHKSNTQILPDTAARGLNHSHVSLSTAAVKAINDFLKIKSSSQTYCFGELADWLNKNDINIFTNGKSGIRGAGPKTCAELLVALCDLGLVHRGRVLEMASPGLKAAFFEFEQASSQKKEAA